MIEEVKRTDSADRCADSKMSGGQSSSTSHKSVPILIDGNNVVRENRQHGWRVLKTLLDWLDNNKKEWFLYFDANIWYVRELNGDGKTYIESLVAKKRAKVCPSRTEADAFILLHADKIGSHIISNDGYKKWESKYPWIATRTDIGNLRVHKFAVVEDILLLPDLGIFEKIGVGNMVTIEAKIKVWRKAAECGDPEAQYYLGLALFHRKRADGWVVDSNGWMNDMIEAIQWYRKAAEQGHIDAQRSLGFAQSFLGHCYFNGDVVKKDKSEAVKWYRKAAECGDSQAQYDLGRCYYEGDGVKMDKTEAVKWYHKAAEHGHDKAQRAIGFCFSMGDGVAQDLEEAETWWRKIIEQGDDCAKAKLEEYGRKAEQGDSMAQYQMGMLYSDEDKCLTYNPWLAAKWFRRAAEQGHSEAQYQLGECYYERFNDFGIKGDESEAVKWYRKAAEQGHTVAQQKLAEC